ncbi:FAD:protein FMN transferase [Tepidibacter thalassicus]|uniref:FAD:protein FMN transferase n=1 Tax=Tepidibacter thalassicus DSM 15285 TaxID=1123350 RepID=A0A1M5NRB5_9FIRM|nr:FAD:protein FMN transferase [Tepidibacter thalassicus]SHG91473.1 Thiamine biosynthesis lipoprotein ApbE [Tepidibacter thalassicus DSM 15285]
MKKLILIIFVGLMVGFILHASQNTAKYEDGIYFAQEDNFNEKTGFKDTVKIEVKDGKIISVDWNGISKNGGEDRKTLSKNGKYPMVEKAGAKAPWHEQAEKVEAFLLKTQDPTAIKYKDYQGHTDAISGVSIRVSEFFKLAKKALDNGPIKSNPVSKTEFVLGTVVTVKIYDDVSEEVFNKIFNRLREIEHKMTINKEDSEVMRINSNSGKDFVKVSNDTFYVIKKGKYFSSLSNGKFDITIGPLVKLWNIGTEYARVPSKYEIDKKIKLVDYNNVVLNESQKSIMLKEKGMVLDLGGIAKGYAADEIVKILKESNIKHAIINLGGNVFAYGNKPDGTSWKIGIQNPFSQRGDYMGIVNISNKTVVTSGIYERFFEKDGKRYHHILDTVTGYPVENNLVGVSIITNTSIDADALSTAVFSLGLRKGMDFIEKLSDVDAIFITRDYNVYITSGLKENFKLINTQFKFNKIDL